MKKNFNILQVLSSNSWGGGELYVLDLSQQLAEDGNNIICISKKSNIIDFKLKSLNIKHYTLPINGVLDFLSPIYLRRIIKNNNIEIIHVHNFKTLFPIIYSCLFFRRKPKIIITRHLIKKAKKNLLYNWLYSHIDNMIFVSNLALEEFILSKPNIPKDKLNVIYNSVKPPIINIVEFDLKKKFNIDKDEIIVSFTGRLVRDKGVDLLIKAFTKLRHLNVRLVISGIGEEAYTKGLEALVRENNLEDKVSFLGFVKGINNIIIQSDIGVFPSVWREPFGLSIIEFMQGGVPVITTNNGAQKEYIINNETGLLIEPNSVEAIAESIEYLVQNPEIRSSISKKGRDYFENNLSYKEFYKNILSVYNN